ncbi:MAG: transposase, partial [Oscillospiraceae bacterium]|nr:transposase [Oscillospiraceae bacterium]
MYTIFPFLRRFSTETEVAVCAYCLMENHVHLLVHDPKGHTPLLMKKLGVCYA